METFSLKGRTAFVTGGNSGIGRAIVELFAAHDAKIAIGQFQREAQAAGVVAALTAKGADVSAVECDVSSESSVARAKAWCDARLGAVDILVNCAGIGGDKPFTELTVADWDRMIGVHLRGTFLVTHAFFADMVARNYGRIILTSSQLAYKGASGLAHYCAAKAGIVGFVRALSYEGAPHNVMVNAIAPGPVKTDILASLSDEWHNSRLAGLGKWRRSPPRRCCSLPRSAAVTLRTEPVAQRRRRDAVNNMHVLANGRDRPLGYRQAAFRYVIGPTRRRESAGIVLPDAVRAPLL